jgi:hypothetical protein
MMDEAGGSGGTIVSPLSLEELHALRSDFEDVEVAELGGRKVRVYALTGTARAKLVPDMAAVAASKSGRDDPEMIRSVFVFQSRVVAASLGYPEAAWDDVGSALGAGAVETLYDVAARLSGLDEQSQAKATERLPRRRNAASGTV